MSKVIQPTINPTRKVWAVVLSGAVVGALQALLGVVMPESAINGMVSDFEPMIYGGVMFVSAYMTKDRA